jgi:hypothetical protein
MSEQSTTPGWVLRYHVPISQVWANSRGGQSGNVHLQVQVTQPDLASRDRTRINLTAVTGRRTTISRGQGRALCGKNGGWYEREPDIREAATDRCARCLAMATRYGVEWPADQDKQALSR